MTIARRRLLQTGMGLIAGAAALGGGAVAWATPGGLARRLQLDNLHTGERLDVAYWENGAYAPDALTAVNHVLRDHRTGESHTIAPTLLDLLTAVSARLETPAHFAVICGYRSPATNALMHEHSSQVASGSLHMQGMAIDIRLPGANTARLRDAAESLGVGGVGYYPGSDFVHVDVGRVRRWSGS